MVIIKRRQFLQFSASTLATIGLSQVDFLRQAQGFDRAMAQGKPGRKLALLVGINLYPDGISNLKGCLTDVEMQYELLVHRYGFDPKDILVLADTKLPFLDYTPKVGTRANILEAFQTHLIDKAESGDTVIFHYSGHGSRVIDPNPLAGYGDKNGTLVPADVTLKGDQTNQIMGKTLFLLSSLLKTDNFTMVLDSCHSGAGTRGSGLIRAIGLKPRNGGEFCRPDQEELAFQAMLMKRLEISPKLLRQRREAGIARGVALGSAQKHQEAIDASFDGFEAGAFTYLLTRYLWQLPKEEALRTTFGSLGLATKEASNRTQEPIYDVQPQKKFDDEPIYLMSAARKQFADAVVRSVEGNQVRFWLGGVSAQSLKGMVNSQSLKGMVNSQSLKGMVKDAVWDVIDEQGNSIATVTQLGREGLQAIGKVTEGKVSLKPGMFMRERLRSIPTDLKLKVGVDPNLGKDVEAAKATLAGISKVESVVLGSRSGTSVDCIFGRLTPQSQQAAVRGSVTIDAKLNSWGLFNSQGTPIPGTFQDGELPVDFAVKSLRSQLKLLLANQILGSTVNGDSSSLKVKTVIRPKGDAPGPVITRMTAGLGGKPQDGGVTQGYQASTTAKPSIVEIIVSNEEEARSLHIAAFALNDDGSIQLLHPASWDSPEPASLIKEKDSKSFGMEVYGPAGFFQVLVVASTGPLRDMLRGIQKIAAARGLKRGDVFTFNQRDRSAGETDDTIGDLMGDLVGDLSRAGGGQPARGRAMLSTQAAGVLSIPVQVVDDSVSGKLSDSRFRCEVGDRC